MENRIAPNHYIVAGQLENFTKKFILDTPRKTGSRKTTGIL
jgi:hypothetical protein